MGKTEVGRASGESDEVRAASEVEEVRAAGEADDGQASNDCGFDDDSVQFQLAARTIAVSSTMLRNFDGRRGQLLF